jgi:hypothetical protein
LHYFGVLWLITTQVKTSDFGVKGGRNRGVARLFYLFDSRDSAIHPKGICGLGKTKEMSL